MYKVLIVEDDDVIAGAIAKELSKWGLEARAAKRLDDVTAEFLEYTPHVVLMDVALTYFNGFHWCSEIRKHSNAPVVFLSSRGEDMDVVMALSTGGDDYITKPVSMEVLIAKLRAILRRTYDYELIAALTLRDASLDSSRSTLTRGAERIELTRNESRILTQLIEAGGAVVSRERLMLKLWDDEEFIDDNTLSVNVNRLRKKLDAAGLNDCIRTHKGMGYSIDE